MVQKIGSMESTIYERIYGILRKRGQDRIKPYEFYELIRNMRVEGNGVMGRLREELLAIGMIDHQIEQVMHQIIYARFTSADSREIEKEMIKRGMIERAGPWQIVIHVESKTRVTV